MALDPTFVGRTYRTGEPYEVGREKIWEFARAIHDPNPVYRDRAAAHALGYPDVLAPPTFAVVLSMQAEQQAVLDPAFGFDFSRVVHRDQGFEYTRPIHAGDLLLVTVRVTAADSLHGNDVVTLRTEIADPDGAPVCLTTCTLVSRATVGVGAAA